MNKLEIKKIDPVSSFKAMIYISILPAALFVVIGLFSLLIGVVTQESGAIVFGVAYAFVMPIIILPLYGVLAMITSLVYNALAGRFGGLKISVEETEKQDQYTHVE